SARRRRQRRRNDPSRQPQTARGRAGRPAERRSSNFSPECLAPRPNAKTVPDVTFCNGGGETSGLRWAAGGRPRCGPNTPHSVLDAICLNRAAENDGTAGGRLTAAHCLPNAIAPTSVCLRGGVTADRPGVLLPAFTHHPPRR